MQDHGIHKETRCSKVEKLLCRKGDGEEVTSYDRNAIGIQSTSHSKHEQLGGHIPFEISQLLIYCKEDNKTLNNETIKREKELQFDL